MVAVQETIDTVKTLDIDQYKYGFSTDIESDKAPKGLDEDTIRFISAKKGEPEWMLKWRLDAFERWKTMTEPDWARVAYDKIDYQDIYYYSAPKNFEDGPKSLDEVDPELCAPTRSWVFRLRSRKFLPVSPKHKRRWRQKMQKMREDDLGDNIYKSGRVAVDAVLIPCPSSQPFEKNWPKPV